MFYTLLACCYAPVSGDIFGFGFSQHDTPTLEECQNICCENSRCVSFQFSEDCSLFGCENRCLLYDTQDASDIEPPTGYQLFAIEQCVGNYATGVFFSGEKGCVSKIS